MFSHSSVVQGGAHTTPRRVSEFLFEISQLRQRHLLSQLHHFPKHLINCTDGEETCNQNVSHCSSLKDNAELAEMLLTNLSVFLWTPQLYQSLRTVLVLS